MKEQQIDGVFPSVHLKAILTADECEQAAHDSQESLDARDHGPLQFTFGARFAQFKEVERVVVFHRQFRI
ncbi:MAG: hypothetical protein RBR19_17875 [Sedimentisphaerales bacterium]|nr:hypothetical protein [Sedimentisphaerales bacterium]